MDLTDLLEKFAILVVVLFAVFVIVYVSIAIFLNKFNKLVYGKSTALAWIPICNIYLLGKLTINKLVGWILVILMILSSNLSVGGNQVTIIPENIKSIMIPAMGIIEFILLIYAIVKYNKMKKNTYNATN